MTDNRPGPEQAITRSDKTKRMSNTDPINNARFLADADLRALLHAEDAGPCVSLYIDTLPATDGKDKNRIRYKDQVQKARDLLEAASMDKYRRAALIEQLDNIGTDEDFWIYQQYGLAVFVSADRSWVRKLMARPGNLAFVAERFHLRPALQMARNAMRHRILCLSTDQVALYEADGRDISAVDLHSDVPTDMSSAIGQPARVHKVDDHDPGGAEDDQLRRYFARVDEAIQHFHGEDTPLVLAALAEHQGLFHEVSSNPQLLDAGVERDPFHGLSDIELARAAWETVSAALDTRIDELLERFHHANAHKQGAQSLEAIGRAAVMGQVDTLLIGQDCYVAGTVERDTGAVHLETGEAAPAGDVIDDLAAMTLRADGHIWFLPQDKMPDQSGAVAILRFAV